MKMKIYGFVLGVISIVVFSLPHESRAGESLNWLGEFCDGTAEFVYEMAWPSARYRDWQYIGVSQSGDEIDLTIRVLGNSGFDGSDLWTNVRLTFERHKFVGLAFSENNALLVQPGVTARNVAQMLKTYIKESARPTLGQ